VSSSTETSPARRPRRGLFLAPFDELADPWVLVELATAAESRGWDGVFLWDHIVYRPPVSAVADPWVALSAIAARTERLRLGPMVTPLSRRRVQKVARETVTLDQLSRGRLTLGVGLGSSNTAELEPFGEVVDPRERARLLDEGLERLAQFLLTGFDRQPRLEAVREAIDAGPGS
jgi:alkanesulfonate monooxygenase SsuD/methylene tetrahydromethanopterin reductase-like flavin-dependent oxidoreductase (luciferase family)